MIVFRTFLLPNAFLASIPVCPFEVAKKEGSTVAVPTLVLNVVEKVVEAAPEFSVNLDGEMKTSAADGAGTTMEHVLGDEHDMV